MRKFAGGQSGLTLVEIMIALGVSSLILWWAWNLYNSGMRVYQRGLQEVALTQEARSVFALMTRDIQRARPEAVPYGIKGMPSRNVSPSSQPGQIDRLEIMTVVYPASSAAHTSAERTPTFQRIRYFFEPTAGETLVLKRAIVPLGRDGVERVIPLSQRVHGLDLRYFDGQVWYDAWHHPALPRAVEMAVVFHDGGRKASPHRFSTVVALE